MLGIFTAVVVTVFLFEFRKVQVNLLKREKEMNQRMYQLSILRELGERIGYSLKIDQIVEIIAGSLRRLLDYSTVSYILVTPKPDGTRKIEYNINLEKPVNKKFIDDNKKVMLKSLNILLGKDFQVDDLEETISGTITDPTSIESVGSFFNVPIVIGDSPVGLLNISSNQKNRYKKEEVEILYTIMNQASDAVTKLQHVLNVEKGKLNSMVASMADGVLMIDNQKQLSVINTAAKLMLGFSGENVTIFEVLDALATTFDLRNKLQDSMREDRLVISPAVTLNNHFFQILISPVKDKDKNFLGSVVLFHDITKEKEVEKMREDFTNMMVHELRSPLTGIKGIASLLESDRVKQDEKKFSEFVNLIVTNTKDMLGLVNDLLDVAKLESGKFQLIKKATPIRSVIDTRIGSFKALADEGSLELVSHVDEKVPENLEFDEHKISQVLNNFLSNSIKFTNAGGKITICAFLLPRGIDLARTVVEQKLVWPGIKQGISFQDNYLVVAVTDTGEGIPADKIDKLFNKFVQLENTAKSGKKGTGLGLVVSKGVVEAHNGVIGVFSEAGEGTTFYFTLPININK